MFSACASEVVCGITRFTPTATTRSSGPNSAAPKGPPLRASTLRRDSSIASVTLSSSEAKVAAGSNASWIQAGRVRWTWAYSTAFRPQPAVQVSRRVTLRLNTGLPGAWS